jgi:AbrB family looped-hinge helix DNA binding protein
MTQITTVSTKGQLVIPAEVRESLGIGPGTRIAVSVEGGSIILEPVSEKLVDETRGMLGGRPSLSKLLQQERRRGAHKDKW